MSEGSLSVCLSLSASLSPIDLNSSPVNDDSLSVFHSVRQRVFERLSLNLLEQFSNEWWQFGDEIVVEIQIDESLDVTKCQRKTAKEIVR